MSTSQRTCFSMSAPSRSTPRSSSPTTAIWASSSSTLATLCQSEPSHQLPDPAGLHQAGRLVAAPLEAECPRAAPSRIVSR